MGTTPASRARGPTRTFVGLPPSSTRGGNPTKVLVMKVSHSFLLRTAAAALLVGSASSCNSAPPPVAEKAAAPAEAPEYFLLRPALEKAYGYSHAVRIGDDLKISGAVSMDSAGNLVAPGDLKQQMLNCYVDLDKVLKHYGYTFDDVVAENVYTTDMATFIKHAGARNAIYPHHFPTGTWLEVKGLALPGQLIEIDLEAHKTRP
jgi:2-iminobutanoate/2-iminopropanoate deaminase